jgi:hypothetical protein
VSAEPKNATEATRAANQKVSATLPFPDRRDFDDGERGLVAPLPDGGVINAEDGRVVWDLTRFSFITDDAPAPDTVAPAEKHWYIKQLEAVSAAENCCHTQHNTYTLRGAPIRDPQAWSKYLNKLIDRWGHRVEVMYGMHHWPGGGNDRVLGMLTKARDGYRKINDQTLRLANHGLTLVEIAEEVEFPPEYAGKKYVEMMGGTDRAVEAAALLVGHTAGLSRQIRQCSVGRNRRPRRRARRSARSVWMVSSCEWPRGKDVPGATKRPSPVIQRSTWATVSRKVAPSSRTLCDRAISPWVYAEDWEKHREFQSIGVVIQVTAESRVSAADELL